MKANWHVLCALASLAIGCNANGELATDDDIGTAEQAIYRAGSSTDVSWWTHDDNGLADTTYATFSDKTYQSGDDYSVFVDVPACSPTDTFVTTFNGMARGDFEYRASLRLTVTQNGITVPIHGAQLYLEPSTRIQPVHILGPFTVTGSDTCRVGIEGKAFTKSLDLFGGATLFVTRHR